MQTTTDKQPNVTGATDQGREIMDLFKQLNSESTTIVQVTHNENWAAYGQRVIRLKDGWMEEGDLKR